MNNFPRPQIIPTQKPIKPKESREVKLNLPPLTLLPKDDTVVETTDTGEQEK